MPFRLEKVGDKFKLFNLTKKEYAKKEFNSREGAIGFAKNAIRYREKVDSKVVGNKILPIKKKDDKKKKDPKSKPKPKNK
tara:strand:+ start:124 stop:363 length:240 start_codon:yes stop_codon:yes gene_type:complete